MSGWRNSRKAMILAVAGAVIFGSSSMAQAGTVSARHAPKRSLTHKMSVKYHNSWKFKSRSLKRCVKIQTHGTLNYTAHHRVQEHPAHRPGHNGDSNVAEDERRVRVPQEGVKALAGAALDRLCL